PKCSRRKMVETLAPSPTTIEVKAGEQKSEPTLEQTALIADLHWLIHQGHILEFADGRLETAKKPLPKPLKPEKKLTEETKSEQTVSVEAKSPEPETVAEIAVTELEIKVQPAAETQSVESPGEPAQTEIVPVEMKPTEEILPPT
ncbi:MAG: hypothetical protein ACREC8_12280, partial [Limisphaerales bacterium]